MSERSIDDAIREAVSAYKAMSPVEKALHDAAQRRSFVRGQMGSEPPRDVLADEVVRLRALLAECAAVLEPFARADNLDSKVVGAERLRMLRGCVGADDFRAARALAARLREAREA